MDDFAALRADIDREMRNLERLCQELDVVLGATTEGTSARVRAAGSVIHDFYTGVEKVFRRIAMRMDQIYRQEKIGMFNSFNEWLYRWRGFDLQ